MKPMNFEKADYAFKLFQTVVCFILLMLLCYFYPIADGSATEVKPGSLGCPVNYSATAATIH